jgi:hypothetical protein
MTAVMACTSLNPAYETTDGDGQSSSGATTGTDGILSITAGSTHDEASGGGSGATTSTGESSSTGDVPLPDPDPLCRFELYAINELGQLHVLDPDRGDSRLRLEAPELVSWAIATEPSTGILYVNQRDVPNTILRVNPFLPEILPDSITVEVQQPIEPLETMARASFRGESELWIGTHETHRFMWVPPTGGPIVAHELLDAFPAGGDMVFIEGGCAVVPTLDGLLHSACFPAMPGFVPVIEVVGLEEEGLQFTGIAIDEGGRLWLSMADPNPGLLHIERAREPWSMGIQIPYDITMNDLAAVIHKEC